MLYNSIKAAIPKQWLKMVKTNKPPIQHPSEEIIIKIDGKLKNLSDIKCKDFYWQYIREFKERATALGTWEELYYFIDFDWKYLFSLPYITQNLRLDHFERFTGHFFRRLLLIS